MNFPWMSKSTHAAEVQALENRLNAKFGRQLQSMLTVIAAATGTTVANIKEGVAVLVATASERLALANDNVAAAEAALAAAKAEQAAARAALTEMKAVQADIS